MLARLSILLKKIWRSAPFVAHGDTASIKAPAIACDESNNDVLGWWVDTVSNLLKNL